MVAVFCFPHLGSLVACDVTPLATNHKTSERVLHLGQVVGKLRIKDLAVRVVVDNRRDVPRSTVCRRRTHEKPLGDLTMEGLMKDAVGLIVGIAKALGLINYGEIEVGFAAFCLAGEFPV